MELLFAWLLMLTTVDTSVKCNPLSHTCFHNLGGTIPSLPYTIKR